MVASRRDLTYAKATVPHPDRITGIHANELRNAAGALLCGHERKVLRGKSARGPQRLPQLCT